MREKWGFRWACSPRERTGSSRRLNLDGIPCDLYCDGLPKPMKLSVVMPVYNEQGTLREVVPRSRRPLDIELICVDDGSRDGSREILSQLQSSIPKSASFFSRKTWAKAPPSAAAFRNHRRLRHHPGRRPGIRSRRISALLQPLVEGKADVVYGSRFLGCRPAPRPVLLALGRQRILTLLSNILTNMNMTDMETCYKVFRREIIQSIPIEENRFGFEPEITVRSPSAACAVYEVGIGYWGRTYEEGKKIGWKDGFRALWCLLKYTGSRSQ